jgi:diguanylate cyclase (GGDEF)-like protein
LGWRKSSTWREFADQTAVVPIENDGHVLRPRRTAAWTRAAIGVSGIALALTKPSLLAHPALGVAGFATILTSAAIQLSLPRLSWLKIEESLAGVAAILIVGLGEQRVTVLSVLWLAAVASGVMARGGRVHWIGRTIVLSALALPVLLQQHLSADQAGLAVAAIGLMLTIGRLTRELNRLLTRARWDADHDDLTGVLSRAAFRAVLERASSRASPEQPVSLLLVDLDGFGVINKTAGHATGDAMLTAFSEELIRTTGESNHAGRLGGDEFAVILPGRDAEPAARRLLEALPRGEEDLRRVSASVGIAQAPQDGVDAEALLRAADIALRVAKKSGTGQISSYAGDSLSGQGMHSARGALSRFIGGDGLSMAVQPIVDLRSGQIHGYEALARFGPDGAGGPLHWLSLAEELGQRDELERACLRAALELYSKRPPGVRLAVNLSAPVLFDRRTLSLFDEPMDLSGLIIEVTEEALVQSDAQLRETMAPLRARGARMAVDDMGAGYSGLRQVTAVHPSYLKLDRSLVAGIDTDDDRAALVGALVGYAERVGCLLVAEGMENDAELQTLIGLKVPLAQGFYLGRPGPPWPGVRSTSPERPRSKGMKSRVGAPVPVRAA